MAVQGKRTRQTGWPNFQLYDSSVTTSYPLRAMRTGYESVWEHEQNSLNNNQRLYLLHETISFVVEVNSFSTGGSQFEAYRAQQTMVDPVVEVADPNRTGTIKYLGTWRITRCVVDDGRNATSTVSVTAEKTAANWVDKDGNAVKPAN